MVLANILVEAPLLDPGVALIVVLMATGLEIARLETGRTNVIAVEREVTLKDNAKTVQRI